MIPTLAALRLKHERRLAASHNVEGKPPPTQAEKAELAREAARLADAEHAALLAANPPDDTPGAPAAALSATEIRK